MTRDEDETIAEAVRAGEWARGSTRSERADLLRIWAGLLDDEKERLAALAAEETGLDTDLLSAEIDRTSQQLRFFAEVASEGSYLEPTEDTAADGQPSMHRWMVPLGPVGVFGPSNFPFAYGVLGTDVASAVSAGCATVVKAHPSHPRTGRALAELARRGCRRAGIGSDVVTLIEGFAAGERLATDDRIEAIGFVGSVAGGRALFDLCAARMRPIPFYGELGSLNPVVVTKGAAATRTHEVASLLATAVLTRHGQMCTKPGLVLVPAQDSGLIDELAWRIRASPPVRLLDQNGHERFVRSADLLRDVAGMTLLATGAAGEEAPGRRAQATLLRIDAESFVSGPPVLREECFGPLSVVVVYDDEEQREAVLSTLSSALVAGIHADVHSELVLARHLIERLGSLAGRVVWDQPTTGLRIGWATHHGGGYPASTAAAHTAVGAAAVRRWIRPVSAQNLPEDLLPAEVCDPTIPRRIDGVVTAGLV